VLLGAAEAKAEAEGAPEGGRGGETGGWGCAWLWVVRYGNGWVVGDGGLGAKGGGELLGVLRDEDEA
jgi:hypothetical protein